MVPKFLNWYKTGVPIHRRQNSINILHNRFHSPNRHNNNRSRSNSYLSIPICTMFSIKISSRTAGSPTSAITPRLASDLAIRTLIPVHHINTGNHRTTMAQITSPVTIIRATNPQVMCRRCLTRWDDHQTLAIALVIIARWG